LLVFSEGQPTTFIVTHLTVRRILFIVVAVTIAFACSRQPPFKWVVDHWNRVPSPPVVVEQWKRFDVFVGKIVERVGRFF
jgi:hypothetical protein